MMQLDAKNIVCCPQLLLFEMFRCWDNANWSQQLLTNGKPKNIWRKFVLFGPTYPTCTFFQDMKPELHIFVVFFEHHQENAEQLEMLKFDWNFFQLHFNSRHLLYW
jgi:hypothetical protein